MTVQNDTDLPEVRSFKDWKKYFYPERINNFVARATCPDDIEAHDPLIKVVEELVTTPPADLQTEFTDFHSLFTAFFEMRASRKPSARKKTSTTHSAFISQEVNYHELGLESWAFAEKVPPYVSREQDAKLDEFLSNTAPGEQLIVISGPAKSGKTRSVVEALKRVRPHSEVIWARRDKGLSTLPSELNTALKRIDGPEPDGYFVVIDDLQLYGLGSPHGFTSELLTKLNKNANIIVTVHSSALKQWKLEIQQHKATSQIPSDRSVFDAVQAELARRRATGGRGLTPTGGSSALTHRITCTVCGRNYHRRTRRLAHSTYKYWWCETATKGKGKACHAHQLHETTLHAIIQRLLGLEEWNDEQVIDYVKSIDASPEWLLTIYLSNGNTTVVDYRTGKEVQA